MELKNEYIRLRIKAASDQTLLSAVADPGEAEGRPPPIAPCNFW